MSNKNILKELVPEAIDNAAKNLTDQPTKNMGTTLADIWYLVFGGISHAAEKRKLKYSYALQEFEKELKDKISKIPEDKLIEPDIQIVAKALEEAKYCVEKEELRHMFSSLISASMNKDTDVSPIMINIISSLSPLNAKILSFYFFHEQVIEKAIEKINASFEPIDVTTLDTINALIDIDELKAYLNVSNDNNIIASILELEHMNLICKSNEKAENYKLVYQNVNGEFIPLQNTRLSLLGYKLCNICLQ